MTPDEQEIISAGGSIYKLWSGLIAIGIPVFSKFSIKFSGILSGYKMNAKFLAFVFLVVI